MKVKLLHATPLWICAKATRTCWASEGLSDTLFVDEGWDTYNDEPYRDEFKEYSEGLTTYLGEKDAKLIDRVANKFKHESVKNHIHYTFGVEGISTKTLLALTRHDVGNEFSVQSTRYTTSKRVDLLKFTDTRDAWVNEQLGLWLEVIKEGITKKISDDDLAMMLPQAYQYSLTLTMSMQGLQHFLNLRLKKDAHYDIQELARRLSDAIPEDHKFMFKAVQDVL